MLSFVTKFVEERHNDLYLITSRVRVSQIVQDWLEGQDPDTIATNYPAMTSAQVYGVLAFYLSHRDELDHRFAEQRKREDATIAAAKSARFGDAAVTPRFFCGHGDRWSFHPGNPGL